MQKTEAIRCVDTANDPFEISLDKNVTRMAMHPAEGKQMAQIVRDIGALRRSLAQRGHS
jgi:hypothetical protein